MVWVLKILVTRIILNQYLLVLLFTIFNLEHSFGTAKEQLRQYVDWLLEETKCNDAGTVSDTSIGSQAET